MRKLSPEAKDLADLFFFETLVRIHRASEGAPYTGLKPAGYDLGIAIPAADQALEDGKLQPVLKLLNDKVDEGLRHRFEQAMVKKTFPKSDLAAGREFVKAYVELVHYVGAVHQAASGAGTEHSQPEPKPSAHEHE